MPEEETKDKKDDDKIVLQVDMHCEGCKQKVRKALKSFSGLEKIEVDMKEQKVTVKGKLDARKVYETVKKKSGKRTVLLYPDLKNEEEKKKEEPKKEEPPPDPEVTVVLKVSMHCAACAKQIKKSLEKMCGVSSVAVDLANSTVIVKGKGIDPQKVCDRVRRKWGKHCEIVPPPPAEEPKKEEAKKEEPKEEKKEEKPAEEKPAEEKPAEEKPAEEKKEEEKPAEEKKEEAKPAEEKKEEKAEEKKEGGEEKKEEKAEEKKEEAPAATPTVEEDNKVEVKKYQYIPSSYRSVHEHVYAPQLFSDENPNACSIM